MIPAYSPQARGRSERNFGTWQGRLPQELRLHGIRTLEDANAFLREHYIAEFNRRFQVRAPQRAAHLFPAQPGSGSHLLAAVRAHGESGQHGQLSEPHLTDRADPLASDSGWLHGDRASAPGWNAQHDARTAAPGPIQRPRWAWSADKTPPRRAMEKTRGGKVKTKPNRGIPFPTAPTTLVKKLNRTYRVLTKPDILTC